MANNRKNGRVFKTMKPINSATKMNITLLKTSLNITKASAEAKAMYTIRFDAAPNVSPKMETYVS